MEHLNKESFKQKVYNFDLNQQWKFEGNIPCVIDFYADWCMPCALFEPLLEEISKEYSGKINVYKVDTDEEEELVAVFGIRSIPTLYFCPMEGNPRVNSGALGRASMTEYIEDLLIKV
jgi:thioredoxin 1